MVRRVLRWLGGAVLATAIALLAATAWGDLDLIWVVLGAALVDWVLPLLLVATVLFAAARSRIGLIATLLCAALTLIWLQPFPHGNGSVATTTTTSGPGSALNAVAPTKVTVMALNFQFGWADATQVMTIVREQHVDVLVATELTTDAIEHLQAQGLDAVLPYRVARPDPPGMAGGTGIFSRYPITDPVAWWGDDHTMFATVEAHLMISGRRVSVVGTHPPPPQQPAWRHDFALITAKLAPRRAQGEQIILAGDLNATVHLRPLRDLLSSGFIDAGTTHLWAWQQFTWPNQALPDLPVTSVVPPMLRLDHVLAPTGSDITSYTTVSVTGSDHRAVIATVVTQ